MRLETKFVRSQDLTLVLMDSETCPLNLSALLPPTECTALTTEPRCSCWNGQLAKYNLKPEGRQVRTEKLRRREPLSFQDPSRCQGWDRLCEKGGSCGIGPQLDWLLSLYSDTIHSLLLLLSFPVLIQPMHYSLGSGFESRVLSENL